MAFVVPSARVLADAHAYSAYVGVVVRLGLPQERATIAHIGVG